MKKGLKVLSTAGLAAVFAASVGVPTQAAVIDRVLEDTAGTVYQYDEVALGKSYTAFIVNEDSKGAALYKHYLNNIKNNPNAFVAFNDDKAGYVTYESVQKAFNKSIVAGEDFNLDNYTESGEGVTAEVKNYVNVTVGEDGAIVETPVTPPVEEVTVQSVSAINDTETNETTVTAVVKNAEEGTTATVTLTPDTWYELEDVVTEDVAIDAEGNVELNVGELPVGTHSVVVTVGEVSSDAYEFTVVPTQAQVTTAVNAANVANAGAIIKALQNPALGLTDIVEANAAAYVADISANLTNTPARLQAAINRVNANQIDTVQGFIDDLNGALNTADMLTALGELNIDNVLAGNVFDVEYFDAIEANSTTTVEEIQAVIDAVNLEEVEALVVEAETKLTQTAHDAVTAPMLDLFEEEVATGFTDRLVAVQNKITIATEIAAVNAATNANELETALEGTALSIENLDMVNNKAAYFAAFDELTIPGVDEFTTVAEIQAFVDKVNADEAQALIDAVNNATEGAALQTALEAIGSPTGFNVEYVQELFLKVNGEKVYTDVASILEDFADINLIAEINNANETNRAGLPTAVKAFVTEYGNDKYINLKAANREEVFGFFHVETMNTELKTAEEVQTALNTAIDTYTGFLTGVNAATTTTEARAALQVWVDQAIEAYGDYATAEVKISELSRIADNGRVTIEAATKLIEATEAADFDGFQTITEILNAANPV